LVHEPVDGPPHGRHLGVRQVAQAPRGKPLQRRELDVKEQAELDAGLRRAFANLPPRYRWLRDWDYV